MKVIACNAPYNEGGMGKFLADLVEASRADGTLSHYFTTAKKPNDDKGRELSLAQWRWLFRTPFLRHQHSWRDYIAAALFDKAVAKQLTPADTFVGFSGRTHHSFQQARKLGFKQLVLESATSHVAHIQQQHQAASEFCAVEGSWLNAAQYQKTLREYELADVITVTSEYSRQSFLAQGIPAAKLQRRWQSVAPRFAPLPQKAVASDVFRVVYVGRLEVSKGVPVLLEAFSNFKDPQAELLLVGGFATDAMEQFVKQKIAADPRIKIRPGDPLPYLHQADVLAHATFEDGLGLGPLEALRCAVPVIVTEDTGMKEFVHSGSNGYVVPTGDVEALTQHLKLIQERPLKGTFDPPSLQPE